jgi:O-glycosyl hydrolase
LEDHQRFVGFGAVTQSSWTALASDFADDGTSHRFDRDLYELRFSVTVPQMSCGKDPIAAQRRRLARSQAAADEQAATESRRKTLIEAVHADVERQRVRTS